MTAVAFVLKYWREIAIGLLVVLIIGTALYIRSVFEERDELRQEKAVLTVQLKDAQANLQLQNQIVEAIGKIRVRSQVNVHRIETEAKPVFADAGPVPFIPGGLLQAVYSSATSSGTASGAAPSGSVPAGESAGGILPQ